jgi:hypothetical protein
VLLCCSKRSNQKIPSCALHAAAAITALQLMQW